MSSPLVEAIFTGKPRTISDDRGTWTSSILRERSSGPVAVQAHGLAGDRVTQPYHGGPDAALCAHLADHYAFWNARYGMNLAAGAVGENLTLAHLTEAEVCVGDQVRLGTALVQVSGPRTPCANLARRIGRPDWVRLTVLENRSGFYLRVLQPGVVQEGDPWLLEQRFNPSASIPAINRCMFLHFDPAFAETMLHMPGLGEWWKHQAFEKLRDRSAHWTEAMQHGGV